jgi:Ca2+:H+ antiporter
VSRRQILFLVMVALAAVAAGVLRYTDASAVPAFIVAGLALAGVAWIVSFSTEALGQRLGPGATGLLQSTLGNLPSSSSCCSRSTPARSGSLSSR